MRNQFSSEDNWWVGDRAEGGQVFSCAPSFTH